MVGLITPRSQQICGIITAYDPRTLSGTMRTPHGVVHPFSAAHLPSIWLKNVAVGNACVFVVQTVPVMARWSAVERGHVGRAGQAEQARMNYPGFDTLDIVGLLACRALCLAVLARRLFDSESSEGGSLVSWWKWDGEAGDEGVRSGNAPGKGKSYARIESDVAVGLEGGVAICNTAVGPFARGETGVEGYEYTSGWRGG
jgi:hypothetical protein